MPRKTHGEVKSISGRRVATPEYRAWQAMRNRCLNPSGKDYSYYGGRGIKIAPQWGDYVSFLKDMGRRPTKLHTLERVDGDGDYTKGNCVWATRLVQARNRKYCPGYAFVGQTHKSWEWAAILGIQAMTLHHYMWRVNKGFQSKQWLEELIVKKLRRNTSD